MFCTPHAIWRQELADSGFAEIEVLGEDEADTNGLLDRGIIAAQGPAQVKESTGAWVIASDRCSVADSLEAELAARSQVVVVAGDDTQAYGQSAANGPRLPDRSWIHRATNRGAGSSSSATQDNRSRPSE